MSSQVFPARSQLYPLPTNRKLKRISRSSSSEEPCDLISVVGNSPITDLDSKGGFLTARIGSNNRTREVFIFPSTGNLTQSERDNTVKVFTGKLNKLSSKEKDKKVNIILSRIVNKETSEVWSKNITKAVKNLPADFTGKKIELSEKQPGPRLPQLASIYHVHSELNTLKVF
jgi:hypothetical protein